MKKLKSGSGAKNFSNPQVSKNSLKKAKSASMNSLVSAHNADYA